MNTKESALASEQTVHSAENCIPSLPLKVKTTFGKWIKLEGPIWRAPSNADGLGETTISVGLLDAPRPRGKEQSRSATSRASMFHPSLTYLIRVFLAESFRKISPRGVSNRCSAFHHFERFLFDRLNQKIKVYSFGITDLTYDLLLSYTVECEKSTAAKGVNPDIIRRFYRWGVSRKIPGFGRVEYLEMRSIKMRNGLRGHIARFRDPQKGAFTWEELVQIDQKILNCEGSDEGRAVASLHRELGLRPEALILLRRRHLEILPTSSGYEFFLLVPHVKRFGAVVNPRGSTRRPISTQLGTLLLKLQTGRPDEPTASLLPFLSHKSTKFPYQEVRSRLIRWADDVDLVTDRLSKEKEGWRDMRYARNRSPNSVRLPVTAYRFRRTLATNLAEQGASQEEIAEFLDDKTIAMAAVYVENTSIITDVLTATLDRHPEWIRVIELFRGTVAAPEDEALPEILGGAPQFNNYEEFSNIGSIGQCASKSACLLEPPLSCYLCPFFRAAGSLLPHERQLLQIRRETEGNIGLESDRMAGVFQLNVAAIIQLLGRLAPSQGAIAKVLARIRKTRTHPSPRKADS